MKPIAALYARVSTTQQEKEATIDSQVAAIETYIEQKGYQLHADHYFLDIAVSGAKLNRPQLDRLRDLAAAAAFDVLICLAPDRLTRKYVHQWFLLDEFQRLGIRVEFVDQTQTDTDPQGQLFLGMKGLFAEYERATIAERLRRGRLHRMRQGKLISPNPAYGYCYISVSQTDGGNWVEHPVEAEVVRRIFAWYTAQSPLTIGQIVAKLNQMGADAPQRGAKQWVYSTVQAILKREAYTGQTYYNRSRTAHALAAQPRSKGHGYRCTAPHLPRPQQEWVTIPVPAIISSAIWEQAQARLKMQKKFAARNNKRNFYLLRGLLVCHVCGHTLIGRSANGQVSYACKNGGKNRLPSVPAHSCSVAAHQVEPLVWQAIVNLLNNPVLLEDAWRQSQLVPDQGDPDELVRLQTRLRTLHKQWSRLLDLYQDELLDKDSLTQRKNELDSRRFSIEKRIRELQQQQQLHNAKSKMLADFGDYCQQMLTRLHNPTPQLQQEVIRLLIEQIVVDDDSILIKHIVPTDDDCRLLPRQFFVDKQKYNE